MLTILSKMIRKTSIHYFTGPQLCLGEKKDWLETFDYLVYFSQSAFATYQDEKNLPDLPVYNLIVSMQEEGSNMPSLV